MAEGSRRIHVRSRSLWCVQILGRVGILHLAWQYLVTRCILPDGTLLSPIIYVPDQQPIMSSEIRQRQNAESLPVVPAEPSTTASPVETAPVEPQRTARRPNLLRNLLLLLLAAGAILGYQQGYFGGVEKPKVIYASR